MYLIFDTETTGLPKRWDAPLTDSENWPRCIQIAWQLHDEMGRLVEHQDYLVQPEGFDIPYDSERIHGISTELAREQGVPLREVLEKFRTALGKSKFVVGQNVGFDVNIMGAEFIREDFENNLQELPVLDTCTEVTADLCKIPGGRGGKFKLPTLTELHEFLFEEAFAEAHNATADVEATTRCFLELIRRRIYTIEELDVPADYFQNFSEENPQPVKLIGLKHINLKKASDEIRKKLAKQQPSDEISHEEIQENLEKLDEVPFAHLHNHSQFSVLQSTISIPDLVAAAAEEDMNAVALTDHANMMGAFHFVKEVGVYNGKIKEHNATAEENGEALKQPIKPIVGCEFFVCENHTDKTRKDNGYQIVMLAKNKRGYHNLAKMSSLAYTDGFYYVPRIDRDVIQRYKEDIIVLTGNLYGEVPSKILNVGENQAEEALIWWKEQFGDDLYIELMRHGQEDEDRVNPVLIEFAKKHAVKIVATNNTYYWKQEDANAHDILLCVKDGEKQATPIGRGRGYRYGLPNQEYYFKSGNEMKSLFKDLPEAITNIQEVVDKIEPFELARDVLLPKFTIPEQFQHEEDLVDGGKRGENAYLKHITFEGARQRYPEITPDIEERLNFELSVIENTGYPGYFLIVEDFIRAARDMGVSVGPGRGSAAGSAVAYCLGITNIDPIKYDLLFERFLNPDRVSMPDIDIDFDDEGRSRVMEYVIDKYGANQVAQIITYGTMAAKSSIRDTARVLDLPLMEADRIAKLIPNTKLAKIFGMDDKAIRSKFRGDEVEKINELLNISEGDDLEAETVNQARVLEGSVRNTGIHACGVIITPGDITDYVPVSVAKDSDLYVTQFDNSVVESAGLLKMDFLGLKTLTLIKDTVKIVKGRHGIELDPDNFPLDDEETYKLFQRGETIGIFQYESPGMQKHMQALKPTVFDDLIAMNALYRPGPMEYIPSFIARKHGDEEISYDLPEMQEYLEETYGITVYQEQVMLLSQKLAGFTKGEADMLRKAMGKKIAALLAQLKPKFIDGGKEKGHPEEVLEKIWKDWEAFASYAFNKSHSTCYAWIAYQTAYLKAHYPAEYMAAVLSNNMNDIKQVTFFMEECKRMKLNVLGPDVNESYYKFSVNKNNAIRFGMGAIKGVGAGAVATIVENRKTKEGPYRSIFDMAKRIDLRAANKKAFENLALAGGFDGFGGTHRAQYFHDDGSGMSFLEKVVKYAQKFQENENSSQVSLFGEASEVQIPEPEVPPCDSWGTMEKLRREKEVVGIYISGHPLDDFKIEMNYFCSAKLSDLRQLENIVNRDLTLGAVVSDVQHKVSKNGKGWAIFMMEDYDDSYEFKIFGEEYLRLKHFLVPNNFVHMKFFVKEGWVNKDTGSRGEPRIQFREMNLLHDVMEKYAKKLTIQLNISDLENEKIEWLEDTFRTHKGEHRLNFVVYEMKEQVKLHMPSRKHKIKISQELLEMLEKEQFLYKLN
ncbi:DNA polymerase III subunit alpha [Christiangramia flava]|uniref:DNA polymerase III subunit alpha n=1 Tax=Christiangramia flava JLT2011 TaxID=1229726 RepID=A0A1L7I2N0_9FLAO|nr:DNA polymerase III subunit alpha [Christiangramia flava]APU67850.1 DNA polymerase III alpha subunit [Christiangramia flava JLT2011]OSS40352.1 DNA polymerase III alpha subunit [Christiangramia flava JLT2011]